MLTAACIIVSRLTFGQLPQKPVNRFIDLAYLVNRKLDNAHVKLRFTGVKLNSDTLISACSLFSQVVHAD